jgi:alpha-1,3-rhamnosyl/mannosyltransferase
VPEQELAGMTAGAELFVYPSVYEGFGFPVAQAMAAGVAVVTSNVSSLPEVVGDGGVLVDPNSTSELTSAMERLLTGGERSEIAAKGRLRAQQFTWDRCARRSLEYFERIAGE